MATRATIFPVARLPLRLVMPAVLAAVMAPAEAHADSSREVAARVVEQWRAAGARVTLLPTRFVFDDETSLVPVPRPEAGDPAVDAAGCTHIAIIGARGVSFRARLSDALSDPLAPELGGRAVSTAGVVELRRCGAARPVRHLVVTSDAGRGALEIIVAHSPAALPALTSVIPERTGGALPPVPDAGALPPLASQDKRAELAESRAKREGALVQPRTPIKAGDTGGGEEELTLAPGCHRVELFARDPRPDRLGRRFRLDVDAELRDPADSDRVLARDRTEAPDARLEACVGRASPVSLVFAGAPPGGQVVSTLASWPLPEHLPALWGSGVRSKMARVMFTRHVAPPEAEPVYLAQGSSGTTPLPLQLEVGGCYLAVVGLTHGHARALQIRTVIGARESTDERGVTEEAALSAFCVSAQESARVEVHARGTAIGWGLAVYRMKSAVWEAGR
ncbi:MAG: hypothetical protein JWP97_1640 [Labilithrix sp.]|nr:hypothetical protein [Labilithrix sp.]